MLVLRPAIQDADEPVAQLSERIGLKGAAADGRWSMADLVRYVAFTLNMGHLWQGRLSGADRMRPT
ncbi:hypothetical protein [Nocardia salmonicida]|uniref:hypothetical protein n=1 Tax=Nocardia salmonicida TaxID=53431 RepID=UPI003626FAC2